MPPPRRDQERGEDERVDRVHPLRLRDAVQRSRMIDGIETLTIVASTMTIDTPISGAERGRTSGYARRLRSATSRVPTLWVRRTTRRAARPGRSGRDRGRSTGRLLVIVPRMSLGASPAWLASRAPSSSCLSCRQGRGLGALVLPAPGHLMQFPVRGSKDHYRVHGAAGWRRRRGSCRSARHLSHRRSRSSPRAARPLTRRGPSPRSPRTGMGVQVQPPRRLAVTQPFMGQGDEVWAA